MKILELPEDERPREKLLKRGAEALTDAELLAIFLRTGIPGKSAIELARELLEELGGLRGLFSADEKRFCKAKGLGTAKYALLKAVQEMQKRYLEAQMEHGTPLTSPEITRAFIKTRLYHYPHEVFACLFLDNRHRVLAFEELFRGTIDGASVHPREVVRRCLAHNAAAIILAHNHPSGVAEPSRADEHLTQALKSALALVDVRVLDHFIVTRSGIVSFAERGLL